MPELWLDPRDEELLDPLRFELLEPDEALRPSFRFELDDDPLLEALRPPVPDRSCELPSPEFVLPEAPRPSLRELLSELLVLRFVPEAL